MPSGLSTAKRYLVKIRGASLLCVFILPCQEKCYGTKHVCNCKKQLDKGVQFYWPCYCSSTSGKCIAQYCSITVLGKVAMVCPLKNDGPAWLLSAFGILREILS